MPEGSAHAATWDVIVVGAGPAGAASAITLARLGQRVLLVEQIVSEPAFKLGESLPPASVALVESFLPDLERPEQAFKGFFKTAGNVSRWDSDQPDTADFYYATSGHGLCLDRLAFDEALRSKAMAAGAALLKGARFLACERRSDERYNWDLTLTLDSSIQRHQARYIVDASGRRAVVAQAQGIEVVAGDPLFAFAQTFRCAGTDDDRHTRIEAAPLGWWYSNRLPGSDGAEAQRIVVLHTDKDSDAAQQAASPEGFSRLLRGSHMQSLLDAKRYHPAGKIRGAPAGSQRLQAFCGDAWLAVGDAAQAYDPLSSQGIDKALRSASHAGHMVHYALSDSPGGSAGLGADSSYMARYDQEQRQLWQEYEQKRDHFYGVQARWPDQPFWRRRRQPAMADVR